MLLKQLVGVWISCFAHLLCPRNLCHCKSFSVSLDLVIWDFEDLVELYSTEPINDIPASLQLPDLGKPQRLQEMEGKEYVEAFCLNYVQTKP